MQTPSYISPALMNWTAKSWPAVLWSVGSKSVLKFAHVRTTRLTSVDRGSGCAAYGHTLWACVNSSDAIGLGWDWALLDYPANCLLVADAMSVASNLRFVDEAMQRYVSAYRSAAYLNRLVADLSWHAEVARQAGLTLVD
ncbi:DUF4902 domain-containing protein [Roseateles sp. DB2]|uniref:DUF4902 domain-containing protein n=1 Tax=Roseateles sp. DB2 TaxID=3453717 RepID=UPI003EE87948